jgi:hypothetical protein
MGVDKGKTLLDIAAGTVSLGAVSMGHRTENNIDSGLTAGSTCSCAAACSRRASAGTGWATPGPARERRLSGRRRPAAAGDLRGGVTNKINQSRLIFNGGLLQTPGGGTMPKIRQTI